MAQKLICMAEKELSRYDVIKDLIAGKINGTDAAKQIRVTVRHVKRLKAAVAEHGAAGLIHKSRGRGSNRKLDPEIVKKAKEFLKEKYYFCQPTLAAEKLAENHKIKINKETVRVIMTNLELWQPKPRKQAGKWHVWRVRKDNYGEMQQFDGSYHNWFGGFETCLLLSADDAAGKITHAKFDYNESVIAVFGFWPEYFNKNGLPLSIYLDKFSTYKINHKNAADNQDMITRFQRAMNQIGVKPITAHSPEAKGRVERMFQALQDRLVKELRLAGITTIKEANQYLDYTVLPERPKKEINIKLAALTKQKQNSYIPPADHPWRKRFLLNRRKNEAVECVLTRVMNPE